MSFVAYFRDRKADSRRRRVQSVGQVAIRRRQKNSGIHVCKDKKPLYIGRTTNIKRRSKEHSKIVWYSDVETVKTKNYKTPEKAARAEKKAIKKKAPKYNIIHNKR